jgi:hypothetical protein
MSTSLHTRVTAGTLLADEKFYKLSEKGNISEITGNNSNASNMQKEGQRFKTE